VIKVQTTLVASPGLDLFLGASLVMEPSSV
jgi:hypothetical protein